MDETDASPAPRCLRCPGALRPIEPDGQPSMFLACPECRRHYAQEPGGPLVFRWGHPISIALYGLLFRSWPRSLAVETAVEALSRNGSPEQVATVRREIELELDQPTQPVQAIHGSDRRTEEECREFLRDVANRLPAWRPAHG